MRVPNHNAITVFVQRPHLLRLQAFRDGVIDWLAPMQVGDTAFCSYPDVTVSVLQNGAVLK